MKKTLTAVFALGNVKKQILAALLPALVCGTQALGELHFEWENENLTVSGEGSFNEVQDWFKEHPDKFTQNVNLEDGHVSFNKEMGGDLMLPYFGILQFVQAASLTYEDLLTVRHYGDTDGPMLYVGDYEHPDTKGDLTLTVTGAALNNWFALYDDHSHLMEFPLIDACMFYGNNGTVSCSFGGKEIGETFEYGTETYKNVGLVMDAGLLQPGQIALLYRPEGAGWNFSTFSLVAVGSKYDPVPEPATGTLSLVALAGLVARRRRK